MTFHGEQVLLRDGQGRGVDRGCCIKVFALKGLPSLFHAEIAHGIRILDDQRGNDVALQQLDTLDVAVKCDRPHLPGEAKLLDGPRRADRERLVEADQDIDFRVLDRKSVV